jgi:hypothetical protein
MPYYAHTASDPNDPDSQLPEGSGKWQLLREHLEAVAKFTDTLSHQHRLISISKNPRSKLRGIENPCNGFRCRTQNNRSKLRGIKP